MNYVSRHFTDEEVACHDGTPYPTEWLPNRGRALFIHMDAIRDEQGGPVDAVSVYRTPTYNQRVGGVDHSQHPEGRAADLRPVVMIDGHRVRWEHVSEADKVRIVYEFHEMVLRMIREGKLPLVGGVGYYPGRWVHVDIRPRPADGHLAKWVGTGVGSEVA